jgi:hypothetical protein
VLHVVTSHGSEPRVEPTDARAESDDATPGDGHFATYSTGFASLVVTLALLTIGFPMLQSVAAPLQTLSSTAMVVIPLAIWTGTWLVFEVVWAWYLG